RGSSRGDPARRAVLGARSDLDRQDRGTDRRHEGRLHDSHRHAQYAAGGAGLGLHDLHVSRRDDRVRRNLDDVHRAERQAHPGLHYRPVRLRTMTMSDLHTTKAFDSDLKELTRMVSEMGGLAEKQIAGALDAL